MNRSHWLVVVALAVPAAGCASASRPPARIASVQGMASDASSKPATTRHDTGSPTTGSVHIDRKILEACGDIPIAHFAFDSAKVQREAASGLDALARCFATGPLRGRGMRLIGHTDSRGETEYNLGLGQRRAGSVLEYVSAHGVERSHLAASSRGEFDAAGTDEEGWARDRKVEVLLAE